MGGRGTLGYVYSSQQPGTSELTFFVLNTGTPAKVYATAATPASRTDNTQRGYSPAGAEGYVFTTARPYHVLLQYTKPSPLEYALTREGHSTVDELDASTYRFLNYDGAVLRYNVTGTQALNIFYNGTTGDYQTSIVSSSSPSAGYTFKGTLGYVFTNAVTNVTKDLTLFRKSGSNDACTMGHSSAPSGYMPAAPQKNVLRLTSIGYQQ